MQIGQVLKIKMWTPQILLHNVKETFLGWLGIVNSQLTLNSVAISTVRTVKKTIGGVGVTGCDYNFTTAANQNEQVIDFGHVIPALARILDIKLVTEAAFTGATTLVAEVGTTTSAHDLINSATIYAKDAILAMAADHAMTVAPAVAASHVFVAATPGANWASVTAGKVTAYITYIEIC